MLTILEQAPTSIQTLSIWIIFQNLFHASTDKQNRFILEAKPSVVYTRAFCYTSNMPHHARYVGCTKGVFKGSWRIYDSIRFFIYFFYMRSLTSFLRSNTSVTPRYFCVRVYVCARCFCNIARHKIHLTPASWHLYFQASLTYIRALELCKGSAYARVGDVE